MEKELVAALFGDGRSSGGGSDAGEEGEGAEENGGGQGAEDGILSAEEVLCRVLQGIARPLQVGTGGGGRVAGGTVFCIWR